MSQTPSDHCIIHPTEEIHCIAVQLLLIVLSIPVVLALHDIPYQQCSYLLPDISLLPYDDTPPEYLHMVQLMEQLLAPVCLLDTIALVVLLHYIHSTLCSLLLLLPLHDTTSATPWLHHEQLLRICSSELSVHSYQPYVLDPWIHRSIHLMGQLFLAYHYSY